MKKIKKAFTLIELIVVSFIITLLSSASVFYFFDFVENKKLSQMLLLIENDILELDKKVKNYEIFDYELIFDTQTWSRFYINNINKFDSKNQELEIIDTQTWSWNIKTDTSWTWVIKIYKKHKLDFINEIDRWSDFEFNFSESSEYKITWTLSWEVLNDIELNYFSENNISNNLKDLLLFTGINISENKIWTWYQKIKIQNINWNKFFYDSNNNEINSDIIYLFFENNSKEWFLKVIK